MRNVPQFARNDIKRLEAGQSFFALFARRALASGICRRFDGREPVSYTHLDVYKRQNLVSGKSNTLPTNLNSTSDPRLRIGWIGLAWARNWRRGGVKWRLGKEGLGISMIRYWSWAAALLIGLQVAGCYTDFGLSLIHI